jgi:hypothetical protein
MNQKSLRIFVTFPAMDLIAGKSEPIIETLGFLIGFLNKAFTKPPKSIELAAVNFEVGHDGAALVFSCHRFLLTGDYAPVRI